ncbi:MAG: polysaccharide pyruvyl transferase family protein [Alphaproteobacteria bacterium]|nr:polysaccharide pyruvyl transferase family protein [Alphaproteobacteria bacterium]
MTFGCLKTTPLNIGEEIQEIAAMRFLPQIDEWVHREHINKFVSKDKKTVKLIMNAWWMWHPERFLPSSYINPLLISMYFRKEIRNGKKNFLTPKAKRYLIEYGPIGCRDTDTASFFNSQNIPAYFSGCLTLTLQKNNMPKKDYILCVDMPDEVVEEIKKRTNREVYEIPVDLSEYYTFEQRLEIAKLYLQAYQNAHCVISSRLHVLLPCLALETPVLRIISGKYERNIEGRFSGYETFVHSAKIDDFLNNKEIYDFENPPSNPDKYLKLRNELIKRCSEFTGCDRQESLIPEEKYPELKMFSLSKSSSLQLRRILMFVKPSRMLRMFFYKKIFKKDRHDLNDVIENIKQVLPPPEDNTLF